ncbi:MAG: 50S ribosomal protein L25/general stress protein Ctc [Pseudomonadota bacterium]
MADVNVLSVLKREGVGKGAARAARRAGLVPGVVYGAGKPPVAVNIKQNELLKALQRGKFLAALLDLDVEGEDKVRVIPKEVQRDVVLDLPTHVDFLRLSERSMITLFVAVELVGADKAPGLARGGSLQQTAYEVRVRCRAGAIPEQIECDISKLKVGEGFSVSDLPLPSGVTLAEANEDKPVVTIAAPRGIGGGGDDDDAEEGGEGEGGEAAES